MTDEQTEQLERIRERYTTALEIIARRGFAREAPQWAMIGFLLGLVDSQVAGEAAFYWFSEWPTNNGFYWLRGWRHYGDLPINVDGDEFWMMFNLAKNHRTDLDDSEDVQFLGPITPHSGVGTAISMRSACIEKVKALADSWAKSVNNQWDDRPDLSFDAAERLNAAGEVITALQSVTIQEQKS